MAEPEPKKPNPLRTGLALRCPSCGRGKLFGKFLTIRATCSSCGVTLGEGDTGDAPMVFAVLIIGFAVVGGALYVEVAYTPPYWVHAMLWVPAILLASFVMLPLLKSLFYSLTFHHDARERVTRIDS